MASLLGTAVSAATKAATTAAKNVSKTVKEKKDKTSSVNNNLSSGYNYSSGANVTPSNGYTATGSYNDHSMQEYNQTDYSKILQAQDAYKQAYAKGDTAGMTAAHNLAESIRSGYGYSGGADGSNVYGLSNNNVAQQQVQQNANAGYNYKTPTLKLPEYEEFDYENFKPPADFEYKDFNYDPTTDAAYKSYAEQFARQGQSASEKALANTSAATGGLTSSYAAAANAQAQQAYAKKTSDMIPVLQANAQAQYNVDRSFDYGKYADDRSFDYTSYLNDRNLNYSDYVKNYDSKVANAKMLNENEWDSLNYNTDRADVAYNRDIDTQQTAYDRATEKARAQALAEQQKFENQYKLDSFDWTKQTDNRDYSYKAGQDSLDNAYRNKTYNYGVSQDSLDNAYRDKQYRYGVSQDAINNSLNREKFDYQKAQDLLASNKKKATSSEPSKEELSSLAIEEGRAAKDPQEWLDENTAALTREDIYNNVYTAMKNLRLID